MYDYETEKPKLFTESGVAMLRKAEAKAREFLAHSGAFRVQELVSGLMGNSWTQLVCLDYLDEQGVIRPYGALTDTPAPIATQHRVYVKGPSYG